RCISFGLLSRKDSPEWISRREKGDTGLSPNSVSRLYDSLIILPMSSQLPRRALPKLWIQMLWCMFTLPLKTPSLIYSQVNTLLEPNSTAQVPSRTAFVRWGFTLQLFTPRRGNLRVGYPRSTRTLMQFVDWWIMCPPMAHLQGVYWSRLALAPD